jgi:hypothetical protein
MRSRDLGLEGGRVRGLGGKGRNADGEQEGGEQERADAMHDGFLFTKSGGLPSTRN